MNNRETTAEGVGWELFVNYLIAKDKFKPDYFLYENNVSASQEIKNTIKNKLEVWDNSMPTSDTGVRYIELNSNLVSAQNRKRFYVHNFGEIEKPIDRDLYLKDVMQDISCKKNIYSRMIKIKENTLAHRKCWKQVKTLNQKSNCCTTSQSITNTGATNVKYSDNEYYSLTPVECERLQTMPDGYTNYVSNTQRIKSLGNGWTAEIIIHILKNAHIPKDEEILVCSMYDGIATGRYCLDKMGYSNIKYYAYEIDKYAIKIATSNYPDILEMGDAFAVRDEKWNIWQ